MHKSSIIAVLSSHAYDCTCQWRAHICLEVHLENIKIQDMKTKVVDNFKKIHCTKFSNEPIFEKYLFETFKSINIKGAIVEREQDIFLEEKTDD